MRASAFFFASFVAFVAAKPTAVNMRVHDSRIAAPASFSHAGPAPKDATVNLRFGLYSNNFAGLEDALYAVSTPDSEKYGQHLSIEEINKFIAPAPKSLAAVQAWLASHGLEAKSASPAGDWINVQVPVSKANELLNAKYETFTHIESGHNMLRTLSYSLPAELHAHIQTVHPTNSFNKPSSRLPLITAPLSQDKIAEDVRKKSPAACTGSAITPACLQSLYGIPSTPAADKANSIAVSGFIEQFANKADLKSFLGRFRPDIPSSTTFALQTLDGGSNPQGSSQAGIEANLDIEYTVGVATGVPVTFISVGENFQDGDLGGFLDIVNFLLGESSRPQVMTTSYGENESDLSASLEIKLCNAYAQLGAAGTSILFASGDGGVSGGQSQSCTKFQPAFPGTCPFLTAVGATVGTAPERAASLSSGGFSNVYGRPSYQTKAVATYLTALGSTNSGRFNTTSRGFPDVAASGQNVEIVSSGSLQSVAGTSCSSPIFASVIGLINDKLVGAGKSPLGFLNPFLYANPGAFNDITSGSNPGCGTSGFPAKAGWDPVTGLGSPNYPKLLAAAQAAAK